MYFIHSVAASDKDSKALLRMPAAFSSSALPTAAADPLAAAEAWNRLPLSIDPTHDLPRRFGSALRRDFEATAEPVLGDHAPTHVM